MSIKIMTLVWESAPVGGSELLTLLAMADWANDQGRNIYPSAATLAHKTRISVDQTRRILRSLRGAGIIKLEEQGGWTEDGNRANNYSIVLSKLVRESAPNAESLQIAETPQIAEGGLRADAEGVSAPMQTYPSYIHHIEKEIGQPTSDPITAFIPEPSPPVAAPPPPKPPTPHQLMMLALSKVILGHTMYGLWTTEQRGYLGKAAKKFIELGLTEGDIFWWYDHEWTKSYFGQLGSLPHFNQVSEGLGRLLERKQRQASSVNEVIASADDWRQDE